MWEITRTSLAPGCGPARSSSRAKRRPPERWREYKPPVQSSVAMSLSGLKLRKWEAQRAGDQPAQLDAIGVLRQRRVLNGVPSFRWPCGQQSRPKKRYYADARPARRGNALLRQTGSTAGPVLWARGGRARGAGPRARRLTGRRASAKKAALQRRQEWRERL